MRSLLFSALALSAIAIPTGTASAQYGDGCDSDRYGRIYCRPGARLGVPMYRSDEGQRYYRRDYRRHYYYDDHPRRRDRRYHLQFRF